MLADALTFARFDAGAFLIRRWRIFVLTGVHFDVHAFFLARARADSTDVFSFLFWRARGLTLAGFPPRARSNSDTLAPQFCHI